MGQYCVYNSTYFFINFQHIFSGHGSNRRDFPEKRQHSCCVRVLIVSNMFLIIAIALSLIVIYRFAVQIKKSKWILFEGLNILIYSRLFSLICVSWLNEQISGVLDARRDNYRSPRLIDSTCKRYEWFVEFSAYWALSKPLISSHFAILWKTRKLFFQVSRVLWFKLNAPLKSCSLKILLNA